MLEVDLRGLACPMPLIKLKKCLAEFPAEMAFKLLLTDRGALNDVPAFCSRVGLGCEQCDDEKSFVLLVRRLRDNIQK